MPRRHLDDVRGQSSLEYLGVLLLVVTTLVTAGSVLAGPALADAVGRQMRHALCAVSGAKCLVVDPQPCLVRTRTLRGSVSAKVALFQAGRGMALLRFERSDGTVDLTLLDDVSAGLQAQLGARGHLDLGERQLGVGLAGEAQVVASLGGGRTWRVEGAKAAASLQHRLEEVAAGRVANHLPVAGGLLKVGQHVLGVGSGRALPPPSSRTVRGQLDVELEGMLGAFAEGELSGMALLDVERAFDGSHVVTLTLDARATAGLVAGSKGLQPQGGAMLSVAFAPGGRPTTATLSLIGTLSEGSGLGVPGLRDGHQAGRRVQADERLDLTEGDNAATLMRLLSAPVRGGLPAAGQLGRLFDTGEATLSRYRTHDSAIGGDVEAGVGVGGGFSAELTDERTQLTGAWTRPPGGAWEQRLDCVA